MANQDLTELGFSAATPDHAQKPAAGPATDARARQKQGFVAGTVQ